VIVKRILLMTAASLTVLLLFTGCKDYSKIDSRLDDVKIENKLPKLGNEMYRTMEDVEDAVYDQQIAACEMLAETNKQTNPQNIDDKYSASNKRVLERCNNKRNEINDDIRKLYSANLYKLMENVKDCPNVDAYVSKTYANVLTFYDEYSNYQNSDNRDKALSDILVYYYDRTNVLAKSFLSRNEKEVFNASVNVIEENARAEDSYRFYINKNNIIIKALNEIYGGVPNEYAERINEAGNVLARNLLNSLESLSDKERTALMDELGLATPSPSPKPTPTPKPAETPAPNATPAAAPTPRPAATPTPRAAATPTPRPAATPTQRPSTQTQQQTQQQTQPQEEEEPLLEFHFD